MVHNDPSGPFGFAPYGATWVSRAEESLRVATNLADAAARSVADWVVGGLPLDAFREDHYRRSKAAERYAHAVYLERAVAGEPAVHL
jgi:hypothetical protein